MCIFHSPQKVCYDADNEGKHPGVQIKTCVSPAVDFQAEGERTGEYIPGGEELTLNDRGESIISYTDYAIAMVDEIVDGSHIQERISVVRR